MSALLDLADNLSDSEEDFDYVPPSVISDVSEEDAAVSSDEDFRDGKNARKRDKKAHKIETKESERAEKVLVVDEKQKANDIWKNFLDEVKTETSPSIGSLPSSDSNKETGIGKMPPAIVSGGPPDKKREILLEFAGEVVSVTGDGCLKPHEDISLESQFCSNAKKKGNAENSNGESSASLVSGVKRKGLDSVLSTIMNKKQKITTLDKTLIDWKSFKKEEGIEGELEKYNRGKNGYIERQRFLERSDLRTFEAEKEARLSTARRK